MTVIRTTFRLDPITVDSRDGTDCAHASVTIDTVTELMVLEPDEARALAVALLEHAALAERVPADVWP